MNFDFHGNLLHVTTPRYSKNAVNQKKLLDASCSQLKSTEYGGGGADEIEAPALWNDDSQNKHGRLP